jgi:hypothetical protein
LKTISAGCNTGPLGSIFCGQVLQIFAFILSYKWRLYSECDQLKISSNGLYPRFWPFTLWIIHHRPLKIIYNMSKICCFKNVAFRSSTFCLSADGFASRYHEELQFESLNTTRTRVQVSRAAQHHLSAAILI